MKDLRWTDVESSGCGRQVNFKIKMVHDIPQFTFHIVTICHDVTFCHNLWISKEILLM